MSSGSNRKDFCKQLALAAIANSMPKPAIAYVGSANVSGQAASRSLGETSARPPSIPNQNLVISVKDYGAKGDGVADDTEHIQRAMQSNALIFFPAGNYLVSKSIRLSSLKNVHLWATGAILTNTTLTQHCFEIDRCEFVTITGGKYTRSGVPSSSWPTDRHCLFFTNCMDVTVQNVYRRLSRYGDCYCEWH
jgi:polygalacturonase